MEDLPKDLLIASTSIKMDCLENKSEEITSVTYFIYTGKVVISVQ